MLQRHMMRKERKWVPPSPEAELSSLRSPEEQAPDEHPSFCADLALRYSVEVQVHSLLKDFDMKCTEVDLEALADAEAFDKIKRLIYGEIKVELLQLREWLRSIPTAYRYRGDIKGQRDHEEWMERLNNLIQEL